jgi:hypothetical protein
MQQPPGKLQVAAASQGDSNGEKAEQDAQTQARKFKEEPWFAKLPPSLRNAVQAKTRHQAPRGYEERLKRYFQSVD